MANHGMSIYNFYPEMKHNRMPGYSGHVPGKKDYGVGLRNGVVSHQSMTKFEATKNATVPVDQMYHNRTQTDVVLKGAEEQHLHGHSASSDRSRVRNRPARGFGGSAGSPYQANMTPGYAGFVPGSRHITGNTEAVTNMLGVSELDRGMEDRAHLRNESLEQTNNIQRLRQRTVPKPSTYTGAAEIPATSAWPQGATARAATFETESAYSQSHGIIEGTTKHIPQKPWASVGRNRSAWTKAVSSEMHSPKAAGPPDVQATNHWVARTTMAPAQHDRYLSGQQSGGRSHTKPTTLGGSTWEGILTPQQVQKARSTQNVSLNLGTSPAGRKQKEAWVLGRGAYNPLPAHVSPAWR